MVPAPDSPPEAGSGSDASSPAGGRSGATFPRHVSRSIDRFDGLLPFALVPLALSLLQFEQFERALDASRGFTINLELQFPSPLLHLWSFVDPPGSAAVGPTGQTGPPNSVGPDGVATGTNTVTSTDFTVDTPFETVVMPLDSVGGETLVWVALLLLVYGAAAAVVAAGYLGGIDRRLRGEPAAPLACIGRYAPRLFLYYGAIFVAFLLAVPILLVSPALLILAIPLVIIAGYLFYAAPFLLVVADAGLLESFRRSYRFAIDGGAYLSFVFWYVFVVGISSFTLSMLVSGMAPGALLALLVTVPLALVLTAATVSFCQELVDGGAMASPPESVGR